MSDPKDRNLVWHHAAITRELRAKQAGHKSVILWFTGLSGSGKSTLSHALEEKLYDMGCHSYVLDGDNVRHGLNKNLGFSHEDRTENIRRVAEVAKLFVEAGVITMVAFISPYERDRESARELAGEENFIEIFCDCTLDVCESRDPKGAYKLARAGKIKDFTGISAPYEQPVRPEISVDTANSTVEECMDFILDYMRKHGIFFGKPEGGGRS